MVKLKHRTFIRALWVLLITTHVQKAHAIPSIVPDLSGLTQPITDALTESVGFGVNHRPYDPATALGKDPGFEMGLETTITKMPSTLLPALQSAGADTSVAEIGIVPAPKLHIRKGLSDVGTLGISGIWWQKFFVYGADFKLTLFEPEEGITVAWRLLYNHAEVLYVTTTTWGTQFLISRKLDFADPYIGIGGHVANGTLSIQADDGFGGTIPFSQHGRVYGYEALIGLKLRASPLGLALTFEGGYHSHSMHWLGLRLAFSF